MSYKELQAKLLISDKTDIDKTLIVWQAALYAVMELHKPQQLPFDEYLEAICIPCDTDYPCPTIQAIQEQLK